MLQPERLLERLLEGYRPPKILRTARLRLPGEGMDVVRALGKLLPGRWTLSGEASAGRYTILSGEPAFSVYATDLAPLESRQDERFFNVLAQETHESFPYFDAREEGGVRWASPVQCWLELSRLGKREKEAAAAIRGSILEELK